MYLKLFQLQDNLLGVARFSLEEEVLIELLQHLKDISTVQSKRLRSYSSGLPNQMVVFTPSAGVVNPLAGRLSRICTKGTR